jgi:hypothetical protein
MRRSSLRLSFLLFLAASVAAQSVNWREYKNPGGNFSILMPSEPSDTSNRNPEGDSHTIQVSDDKVSYNVFYVRFRQEQKVDDANFKAHRDGFLGRFPNCHLFSELPASPALNGLIGGSYVVNCEIPNAKTNHVANIYLGKHYFYAVFAMYVPDPSKAPNPKKFVDSFALIDPAK